MANSLRRCFFSLAPLAALCVLSISGFSQTQPDAVSKRRVVERTTPAYPALARSMALQGIVRLDAVVSADGSVLKLEVRGGHPVLAQSATNAVRHWKWERAPHESRELVEVKFDRE
jgi:TonB family protein